MMKDSTQIQRRGNNATGTVLIVEDSRALQGLLGSYSTTVLVIWLATRR